MEVVFPFEFTILGTPPSLQSSNPKAKEAWKDNVRASSQPRLPEQHFAYEGAVAVTIFYFPDGPMVGDLDNILKYTLDGLSKHIIIDDGQVERIVVQKFEPDRAYTFENPSEVLLGAIEAERPVMYIKLSNNPLEELL